MDEPEDVAGGDFGLARSCEPRPFGALMTREYGEAMATAPVVLPPSATMISCGFSVSAASVAGRLASSLSVGMRMLLSP